MSRAISDEPPAGAGSADAPSTPRRYTAADEDAVVALLERCFDRPRDRRRRRWQVRGPATGWSRPWVLEQRGEIIGHAGIHAFASFVDRTRCEIVLAADLAVAPEHRGGGLVELMRTTLESVNERRMPMIAFPNDAVVEYGRRRDFPALDRLPQWVRWLTPAGFAASRETPTGRLLAPFAAPAMAAVGLVGTGAGPRVEPLDELGEEVDELAAESATYAPCIRVRDADYLRWRWVEQPGSRWRLLAARGRDRRLLGLAVVGADPDTTHGGAPVGRIPDLLARDGAATAALLRAAAAETRRGGCSIAAFDYLDPRPWARSACRRAGFVERGVGPSVLTGGTVLPPGHPARAHLSWYLTRGDSDLA